ncbi:unnamed protein product [Caenorhabditis nigoni]
MIGIVLYLMQLCFILSNAGKIYGTTYYYLRAVDIIVNLITIENGFIMMKLTRIAGHEGLLVSFYDMIDATFACRVFIMLSYLLAYYQYIIVFIISVNRVVVLFQWKSSGKPFQISMFVFGLASISVPIVLTWGHLNVPGYVTFNELTQRWDFIGEVTLKESFMFLNYFMTVFSVLSLVINSVLLKFICCAAQFNKKKQVEIHLIVFTFIEAFVQCAGVAISFARVFDEDQHLADYAFYLPYVSDALSMHQAVLLFCFSVNLRRQILGAILCRKKNLVIEPAHYQANRARFMKEMAPVG